MTHIGEFEKVTVFIDESGNAGANLLDQQPVFTLAGVSARDTNIPNLDKKIANVISGNTPVETKEIKGAYAIRQNLHPLIKELTNPVLNSGQPIFWSVVERRFMVAALIVDNFYDYVYNDNVGPEWTYPSGMRQDLANHFYDHLSDQTLQLAARALVVGDTSDIRQLIQAMENELAEHKSIDGFDAVSALTGVHPHIEELSAVLTRTYSRKRSNPLRAHRGTVKSPNITSFFELINRIEDYFRGEPKAKVRILFDSSCQFNEAFSHVHQLLKEADGPEFRFPGRPPIIFGFKAVTSFSAVDSEAHSILQVADFFASGIRAIFELLSSPIQPPTISKSLEFFLAFIALNLKSPLYTYVVSDSLSNRIWPAIERYKPR